VKIAILGTGMVGATLGTKLLQQKQEVMMGSRTANSEGAQMWLKSVAGHGQIGTFAQAAAFGEIIFDCTNGANALAALHLAGSENLGHKILIQIGNPLDFSKGMPPSLTVCNTDSLGEQTQREFPEVRVVKALNTVNCEVMINPARIPGDHALPICGNDSEAKKEVAERLTDWFGWKPSNIVDLGDITGARGTEMYLPLWLRLWGAVGTPVFNFQLARGK
jgi:8-hydroxy-5-deazaflavin:NADPH oxidoreductase